jgi:hypothetical protein
VGGVQSRDVSTIGKALRMGQPKHAQTLEIGEIPTIERSVSLSYLWLTRPALGWARNNIRL